MSKKFVGCGGAISGIDVRIRHLKDLQRLDPFLTVEERDKLDETELFLKELRIKAIRRLWKDEGHPLPMIANAINASTNAVLEMGKIDPMTFKLMP